MKDSTIQTFSGFGFDKNGPYFIIDELKNRVISRKKFPIIDNEFTIKLLDSKYCIGRYDLRSFDSFPCPNMQLITSKENVCFECFKFNAFNPSFYNVSVNQLSTKQREYNLSPHNVYLAYFSKNHIKVGISHHSRNLTRWLEQGARVATIVFKCATAYEAREIEEKISSSLNLSESFRSDQKRLFLKDELNFENAIYLLKTLKDEIEILINREPIESEFLNFNKQYLFDNSIQHTIIDISIDSPLIISGVGIGLIGDTLIFQNAKQQFMFSLKKFISHEISFNTVLIKQEFTPHQTSLF